MNQKLNIKWYNTIDSTNSQAIREAEIAHDCDVWIADFQTNGRGQRGNKWESKKGENLTFTILFKPEFLHPSKQFFISEISALGVCKYLINKGLNAKIKWPNDVYVGDKKICGMLIEHTISGDKLAVSLSGIGVNLNQTIFDSNAPNPTSMFIEFLKKDKNCKEFDRRTELTLLLTEVFTLYSDLQNGYGEEIFKEYKENLYRLNEFHKYIEIETDVNANVPVEQLTGKEMVAKIIDVLPNGCVLMEKENGEVRDYAFKEIKYVL